MLIWDKVASVGAVAGGRCVGTSRIGPQSPRRMTMRVLVCAASKHGATAEIAREIGLTLGQAGIETVLQSPDRVEGIGGYDAIVLGSAVYMGRWMDIAKDFVERHRNELTQLPVWLFSSGPLGDPPIPTEDPIDVRMLVEMIAPRGHRVFAGDLARRELGLGEKTIVSVVRAQEGDFRPWDEIGEWARAIAAELGHPVPGTPAAAL
jgi:menaquinone-dependent protoporphyrinogen oxidase